MDFDAERFRARADHLISEMAPFFMSHDEGELLDALSEAAVEAAGGDEGAGAAVVDAVDALLERGYKPSMAAGAERQMMLAKLKKQTEKKKNKNKKKGNPHYESSEVLQSALDEAIKKIV